MFAGLVVAVVFLVTLVVLPPVLGLVLAAVVSLAVTGVVLAKAADLGLRLVRARPAQPDEHARLDNLVESLCFSSGLPKPGVYVVEDEALNVFVAGTGPRHAAIGVTSGLLGELTRVELEAVLANGLSLVKSRHVLLSTLALTLVAVPASVLPVETSARLVAAVTGPEQRSVADLTGVSLTRYPPGLISAFEKLRDGNRVVSVSSRATAPLWLYPPDGQAGAGGGPGGEKLQERIEALREL